jgi:hypothetical protein
MSSRSKSRVGRPAKYPPEFRRDAVAMVLDEHRSIADVGRSVGVNAGTLGNWVGEERIELAFESLGLAHQCIGRGLLGIDGAVEHGCSHPIAEERHVDRAEVAPAKT